MIENYLELSSHDILKLSNNDLKKIYLEIRSEIIRKNNIQDRSKELEILYCYLVKEIETRN